MISGLHRGAQAICMLATDKFEGSRELLDFALLQAVHINVDSICESSSLAIPQHRPATKVSRTLV
jgi:hypothetical protein